MTYLTLMATADNGSQASNIPQRLYIYPAATYIYRQIYDNILLVDEFQDVLLRNVFGTYMFFNTLRSYCVQSLTVEHVLVLLTTRNLRHGI